MATDAVTIQHQFTDGGLVLNFPSGTQATSTQSNAGRGAPVGTATTTAAVVASMGTVNTANDYRLTLRNHSTTVEILLYSDSGSTVPLGKIPVAPSANTPTTVSMVFPGGTSVYTDTASGTAAYSGVASNI